ncbi:pyruvate ferredoxin/flavodoxin oxidoreductase, beta subunit [Denitrovibrio acetiphilus DSM 12809]|uniref:Pyruvate ferredoxin/flavodoxin oxidoreductase, beta subunit n=1 Tax=Denitrovibrio acetiphilus (strain DSM 12809 / NBRC 114555 / N2460) TaxID=522772 RepID=D4H1J6_DENA2|nr:thiamine pyrophosphate-dependent enzyme [Denitrovibrio acetiphilus]ADD68756.1 pyruvate ferredoxin/flavodoxin oxidoreductase, beta subunit [Denitrovibrio acetiphilus DSM 12809]
MKPLDYNTGKIPVWCPGCGNFAIWNSIKKALASVDMEPHKLALVSGIGCSGKMINHVRSYGFHALHGRALPVATGIKLANPDMTVLVNGGDGDGYGMGIGHLIHAIRRNIDVTYVVHHNKVYGLTTGQAAPTSPEGTVSKSTPFGVVDSQLNPLILAMAAGATYVARGYSGESDQLAELIEGGIRHNGFALIDVLQPCVTFGGEYKYDYYNDRVVKMDEIPSHDKAIELAQDTDHYHLGVFSQYDRPAYNEQHPEITKGITAKDVTNLIQEYV